jgi:hypothetical protein
MGTHAVRTYAWHGSGVMGRHARLCVPMLGMAAAIR